MTDLLRRFRSVGIALAVLAISASIALAAAPPAARVTSHVTPTADEQSEATEAPKTAEPTESPEATEAPKTAEPTESPEATAAPKTAEPTESPEATAAPEAPKAAESAESPEAPQDAHGAMVSKAAKLPTPAGFKNHGAFVSCVAHMDAATAPADLSSLTPALCGLVAVDATAKSAEKTAAAKVKAEAGKARGQAASASHGKSKNHPTPAH